MEISKRFNNKRLDTTCKMIIVKCDHCGKELGRDYPYQAKGYNYCNASCQMHHAYKIGLRDKYKIAVKAQKASQVKMKKHNWLNNKKSRDKQREVMQTDKYRINASLRKVGDKNPMFGKKGELAGHYKGGSCRTIYGTSFRGPLWKKIKLNIRKRDNNKCRHCGTEEYLQVHHIVPFKCTQDNSEDNLITLCSKCHAHAENNFCRVQSIEEVDYTGNVHNFSVEQDETYVANNMIVHNCRTRSVYIQPKVKRQ